MERNVCNDNSSVVISQFATHVKTDVENATELSELLFEQLECAISSLAFAIEPASVSAETKRLLIQILDMVSWAYNNRHEINIDNFKERLCPVLIQLKQSVEGNI